MQDTTFIAKEKKSSLSPIPAKTKKSKKLPTKSRTPKYTLKTLIKVT